jgi:hypothetical protein
MGQDGKAYCRWYENTDEPWGITCTAHTPVPGPKSSGAARRAQGGKGVGEDGDTNKQHLPCPQAHCRESGECAHVCGQ